MGVAVVVLSVAVIVLALALARQRRLSRARVDAVEAAAFDLLRRAHRLLDGAAAAALPQRLSDALDELAGRLERDWRAAQLERRRLRSVLAGLRDGVILLDRAGNVLLANAAAADIWPRLAPRLVGLNQIVLFHDAALDAALWRARDQRLAQSIDHLSPGPPRRHFEVRLLPLPAPRGNDAGTGRERDEAGVLLVVRDTTDRHSVDEMRRDFVANVSHELQTPLTSIQGFAETLRDAPDLPVEQRQRFLSLILAEGRRMTALVRDLLELARLESGAWRGEREGVDLAELARQAVDAARPAAERKGLDLQAGPLDPAVLLGYADELRRAIDNLVANAIVYTPGGGRVAVRTGRSGGEVFVTVEDSGIGIPADEVQRVFERFYRVDKGRSRAAGGTGLGLSIVRHVVDTNGGRLEVDSREGRGSRFSCSFPARPDSVPTTDG